MSDNDNGSGFINEDSEYNGYRNQSEMPSDKVGEYRRGDPVERAKVAQAATQWRRKKKMRRIRAYLMVLVFAFGAFFVTPQLLSTESGSVLGLHCDDSEMSADAGLGERLVRGVDQILNAAGWCEERDV